MTKFAHIADTHIRNLKYHYEYKVVFNQLYEHLKNEKIDYIVHCGDIAHTKTQISPEFVDMARDFFQNLASIAPTYIILGNHDGNLKNSNRQDAISPIIKALDNPNLHLLKNSGEAKLDNNICLNVLSVFDEDNWADPSDDNNINIALYHGSISNCRTDVGWLMSHGEHDIEIFDKFDYAMLGDIHKPQALDKKGRIRYAGSTIQQNFGETNDKGILIWDIKSKEDFTVKRLILQNPRPFVTLTLDDKGKLPKVKKGAVPPDCRLRLVANTHVPLDKFKQACETAKFKWKPQSVTFLNRAAGERSSVDIESHESINEDLRDIRVQEELIKDYLKDYEVTDDTIERVMLLNKKCNDIISQTNDVSRNVNWQINKFEFDNLFNYGEDNYLDFGGLNGIVGIFGKNFTGKSSIIDAALFTMFGSTSKNERKNLNVINQNKENCESNIEVDVGNKRYTIERKAEKYIKKLKGVETLEAKTSVDFYVTDKVTSETVVLNGLTRNETDKNIRNHFGSMDDFMLTSLSSQHGALNFINEGSTKRKEIFAKFLDLEQFESKFKAAKSESSDIRAIIRKMETKDYQKEIKDAAIELAQNSVKLNGHEQDCEDLKKTIEEMRSKIGELKMKISAVPTEIIDISDVKKNIEAKKNQIYSLTTENKDIEHEKKIKETLYSKICAFLEDFDIEAVKKEKENLVDLQHKASEFLQNLKAKEKEYKNNYSKKKLLDGIPCGTQFPKCKFIRDAHVAVSYLPVLEAEKKKIRESIDSIRDNIADINPERIDGYLHKYEKLLQKKIAASTRITEISLQTEKNESAIELASRDLKDLEAKVEKYEQNKEAIENFQQLASQKTKADKMLKVSQKSLVICEREKMDLYKVNGSIEQKLANLEEDYEEYKNLREDFAAYDLFMRCMHSNGIAFDIIKKKLPIINEEIAKTLANIVDFEVFFEIDGNKFDIFIKHPRYQPRPLEMGSGAEKTIAAMAIRMALLSVSSIPKGDIFILDEPGTALDEENMEGFIRMLELIKMHFKTVLLISHLDSLKDCVDMQIVIDKKNGYAHVNQ